MNNEDTVFDDKNVNENSQNESATNENQARWQNKKEAEPSPFPNKKQGTNWTAAAVAGVAGVGAGVVGAYAMNGGETAADSVPVEDVAAVNVDKGRSMHAEASVTSNHASASASVGEHASADASVGEHSSADASVGEHSSASASVGGHTSEIPVVSTSAASANPAYSGPSLNLEGVNVEQGGTLIINAPTEQTATTTTTTETITIDESNSGNTAITDSGNTTISDSGNTAQAATTMVDSGNNFATSEVEVVDVDTIIAQGEDIEIAPEGSIAPVDIVLDSVDDDMIDDSYIDESDCDDYCDDYDEMDTDDSCVDDCGDMFDMM